MRDMPFSANNAFNILLVTSLATSILLIGLLSKLAPLAIDHTVYFCKQAINSFSLSLPHSAPSLFVLVLGSLLAVGFLLLALQIIRTQLFIKKMLKSRISMPRTVKNLARELGIMDSIDVIKADHCSSFCYGFFKPRICLDLNLIKKLTNLELKAVLIHEKYHLKNRDPLKILLSQIAMSMFFFIPSLRDMHNYYSVSKEIYADQLVSNTEGIKSLRSALIKTLSIKTLPLIGVASFVKDTDIEQRINILVNPALKIKVRISIINVVISGIVFVIALTFLNLPVHAMEDKEGTHAYYLMSSGDAQMVSCVAENTDTESPLNSQQLFSPENYSTKH